MGDCNTCLWAQRDGGCACWYCWYINMEDAADAYKIVKKPISPCIECQRFDCNGNDCQVRDEKMEEEDEDE